MSDAIAAAALALFDDPNLGQSASYTPAAGGAAVALRVRLTRPVADPFGNEQGGRTAAAVAHVALAALTGAGLSRPTKGAALVVDGVSYKVAAVELDLGAPVLRLVLGR